MLQHGVMSEADPPLDSVVAFVASEALLAAGDSDAAEELLGRILARYPEHEKALLCLAGILERTERPDGAADCRHRAALAAVRSAIDAAAGLAGTPNASKADALIERTAARFPDIGMAQLALAELRRRCGRIGDALAALRRCLAIDPADRRAAALLAALQGYAPPQPGDGLPPAPAWIVDGMLERKAHDEVLALALQHEARLAVSTVAGRNASPDWRRSRVDRSPEAFRSLILPAVLELLDQAVARFGLRAFSPESLELQFTAHNEHDYYKVHRDMADGGFEHRRVSFVYYFHRRPRGFSGGELALFDSAPDGATYTLHRFTLVEPMDNRLALFPSTAWHAVQPVTCPSGRYEDSRFTLNGWLGVRRTAAADFDG